MLLHWILGIRELILFLPALPSALAGCDTVHIEYISCEASIFDSHNTTVCWTPCPEGQLYLYGINEQTEVWDHIDPISEEMECAELDLDVEREGSDIHIRIHDGKGHVDSKTVTCSGEYAFP